MWMQIENSVEDHQESRKFRCHHWRCKWTIELNCRFQRTLAMQVHFSQHVIYPLFSDGHSVDDAVRPRQKLDVLALSLLDCFTSSGSADIV